MEEKKYGYSVLRALMGNCKGVARADLLGVSNDDRESVDYFLQDIERRADGLYLNRKDTEWLNRDEFAAVTGDFEFTRDIGAPLLPIPFTVEQLSGVEAALGIVERLSAGEDTDELLKRLKYGNADAAVVAGELLRMMELQLQSQSQSIDYNGDVAPVEAAIGSTGSAEDERQTWADKHLLVAAFSPHLKPERFHKVEGWLLSCRREAGVAGRGSRSLFCPYAVMQGLRLKTNDKTLTEPEGWRILHDHFPKAYGMHSPRRRSRDVE